MPALRRQRQADLCELKAILGYTRLMYSSLYVFSLKICGDWILPILVWGLGRGLSSSWLLYFSDLSAFTARSDSRFVFLRPIRIRATENGLRIKSLVSHCPTNKHQSGNPDSKMNRDPIPSTSRTASILWSLCRVEWGNVPLQSMAARKIPTGDYYFLT